MTKAARVAKRPSIAVWCCNITCGRLFNLVYTGEGKPSERDIAKARSSSLCARCVKHASVVGTGSRRRLSFP